MIVNLIKILRVFKEVWVFYLMLERLDEKGRKIKRN